ncbi:MAG: fasciclin domain-containing protein [Bacteroidales bacterium]|nr:fasciclin domain-containing protein [Bacteroidales bacterium]
MKLKCKLITCLIFFFINSCKKTWDEHYSLNDKALNNNLLQAIENNDNLSTFYDFLVQTGYHNELQSSKSYLVWAPDNDAFLNIDHSITADSVKLKHLIGYYISIATDISPDTVQRIKMMNGKYAEIDPVNSTIEKANIIESSEIICKNGVLRTINKAYIPKLNTWEYFMNGTSGEKQRKFIEKLYTYIFDEANSEIIGVDEQTGFTIYDSILIWKNSYLVDIADLESEEDLFTYIVLSDNAFDEGFSEYNGYFKPKDSTLTDSLTAYNVCSDLAFNNKYSYNDLPIALVSTTGITVDIYDTEVDSFVETSNGIIYFMSTFPIHVTKKFSPLIIQGEEPEIASSNLWIVRNISEALGGYDLYYDHQASGSWVQYSLSIPYPAKYSFYWVAVTDASITYKQNLALYNYNPGEKEDPVVSFPFVSTTKVYATEIILGEYTFTEEKNISLRIFSEDNNPPPPISLDYIKIVPVNQ